MSAICKNCSAELTEGAKFCTVCGHKVEIEPVAEVETVIAEEPVEETAVEAMPEVETAPSAEPETEFEAEVETETAEESLPAVEEVPAVEEAEETVVADLTPVVPQPVQLSKKELKEALKQAKEKEKADKKAEKERLEAEKLAEKQANKTAKPSEKPARKKASALGVVAAIFLSLFLIINVVISIALVMGIGVTKADVEEFAISVNGETYSVESINESAEALREGDTKALLDKLVESEDSLVVGVEGESYEIELTDDTLKAIETIVLSEDGVSGTITGVMDKYLDVVFVGVLSVLVYIAVIIVILIISIVVALGKSRRAFLLPGIIFAVIGVAALAAFIIGVVAPELFGLAIVEALFGIDTVATCALIAAAITSIIGVIFVAIGATATSKE